MNANTTYTGNKFGLTVDEAAAYTGTGRKPVKGCLFPQTHLNMLQTQKTPSHPNSYRMPDSWVFIWRLNGKTGGYEPKRYTVCNATTP